jgi:hypothetical protein
MNRIFFAEICDIQHVLKNHAIAYVNDLLQYHYIPKAKKNRILSAELIERELRIANGTI